MNADVIARALAETARKRRLLSTAAADRLATLCRSRAINSVEALQAWLESGDGLSAHLASQLVSAVAPADQRIFERWLTITHLADGGMGSVWMAASPENELVVIKTLRASGSLLDPRRMEEQAKRFEREAAITQHLVHPGVVRCLGSGILADNSRFMALEYVDSGDLRDLVEARGGLGEGLALAIVYQAVEALDAAGKLNLVHRDIKPANIFVSSQGQAKLADFGIARSTESDRTMLTMEGAIVGSPHYMAPEQVLAAPDLDGRVDIYAMGCVLYFALAAAPPFSGKLQDILHAHCTASVPDIRVLRPVVSELSHRIIATCMAKERDRRFTSAAELRDALANALVHLGLTPGRIEESTRPADLSGARGAINADLPTAQVDLRDTGGGLATATLETGASPDDQTIDACLAPPGNTTADDMTLDACLAPGAEAQGTTMATMLTGDQTGVTMLSQPDLMTMVCDLMEARDPDESGVTLVMPGASAVVDIPLTGDLDRAMADDHLALVAVRPGAPDTVLLWARCEVLLGKLREPPIDLCLRNYPVQQHLDECMRISRKHLLLRYDALELRAAVCDQGSPNGSELDGIRMTPHESGLLDPDTEHLLLLAEVLSLRLRALSRQAKAVARSDDPRPACGLECDHALDAVLVTRPANRPELAYAMVLRRLSIGGPGADLVLAGARSRSACELARYRDRWIFRRVDDGEDEAAWRPLQQGEVLDCGGIALRAEEGCYEHID